MAQRREQDEPKGWGVFFVAAVRASVDGEAERESIWSVSRPLIRLYLLLFTIQSGWLFWKIFRKTVVEYPGSRWDFIAFETLEGVSSRGLGVAISSLIVVEGVSTLMVMYSLGMNLIVRPIIRWHERRGEERGIAIGAERTDQEWRTWYQRFLEHQAHGEPFDEPPPPPPYENGSRQPED